MKLQSMNSDKFRKFDSEKIDNLHKILGGMIYKYSTNSYHISDGQRDGEDNAWWTDSDNDPMNGGYSLDDILPKGQLPDMMVPSSNPPTGNPDDEEVFDPVTGEGYYV